MGAASPFCRCLVLLSRGGGGRGCNDWLDIFFVFFFVWSDGMGWRGRGVVVLGGDVWEVRRTGEGLSTVPCRRSLQRRDVKNSSKMRRSSVVTPFSNIVTIQIQTRDSFQF
jgi:hypothetical protein